MQALAKQRRKHLLEVPFDRLTRRESHRFDCRLRRHLGLYAEPSVRFHEQSQIVYDLSEIRLAIFSDFRGLFLFINPCFPTPVPIFDAALRTSQVRRVSEFRSPAVATRARKQSVFVDCRLKKNLRYTASG